MKRFYITLAMLTAPVAAHAAATCPTGYITVDMPDVEIAETCDTGYTSAGTIDDCSTGAGVCAVADITCEPGQYIEDGECKICGVDEAQPQHYCPDGINAVHCPPNLESGGYGWTWCSDTQYENVGPKEKQRYGCTKITNCVSSTNWFYAEHGSGTWNCPYNEEKGEYENTATRCGTHIISKCDAGYYKDTSATPNPKDCTPVGAGYYSPADSIERKPCPTGYTTRTDTATSEDECNVCADGYGLHGDTCEPLCTAGATMLHVGPHTFNLYPDSACASPAIHIGLSGGTCCAHLVPGEGVNAMHVRYNNTVYHTTN